MISNEEIDLIIDENWKKHKGMNNLLEVKGVLRKLVQVLNSNIEGDIVELGCNNGGTSYWIQLVLKIYKSEKKFHVYDSWEGVPDKTEGDNLINYIENLKPQIGGDNKVRNIATQVYMNDKWAKGWTTTSLGSFVNTFHINNQDAPITYKDTVIDSLELPIIHSGWFKDIPDIEYPDKICFAFFDGDFYSSIMDSFNKVYEKCVTDAIIVIDDCGDNTLVGVENACNDFLKDRPETLRMDAYPDINGNWDRSNNLNSCYWGGWLQKT